MGPAARLRLAVYGVLALCAALVLAARPDSHEPPEAHWLVSTGAKVELAVVDGEVSHIRSQSRLRCPGLDGPTPIEWAAVRGVNGRFRDGGSSFRIVERWRYAGHWPASHWRVEVDGRLGEGGRAARGRIVAAAGRGSVVCFSTTHFSAR